MKIPDIRQKITDELCSIGIDAYEASHEANIILSHFLGLTVSDVMLAPDNEIQKDRYDAIFECVSKRTEHIPLQYILGKWEFFGLEFFCGEGCLIPRPETEFLVERITTLLPKNGRFLDLCTGSGCVAISVLVNRPDSTCVAVDISQDALFYTKKNAALHNVCDRMDIVCADAFSYLPFGGFDVVASNPPYIKSSDLELLSEEVKKEPVIALDGGCDGLDFYRMICERYKDLLPTGGAMIFEAGYDTTEGASKILKEHGFDSQIIHDYSKNPRVCVKSDRSHVVL